MTDALSGSSPMGALNVFADLRLVSAGRHATLTGDGRVMTFTTDVPQELLAGAPAIPLRAVGRIADLLDAAHLEFRVVGPKGEIARLGSGASSWWGSRVTGSKQIQIGSLRVVGPLALSAVRRSVHRLVRNTRSTPSG